MDGLRQSGGPQVGEGRHLPPHGRKATAARVIQTSKGGIVSATSVQTGHVFRDRLDFLFRHAEGGAGHGLAVIGAVAGLESQ